MIPRARFGETDVDASTVRIDEHLGLGCEGIDLRCGVPEPVHLLEEPVNLDRLVAAVDTFRNTTLSEEPHQTHLHCPIPGEGISHPPVGACEIIGLDVGDPVLVPRQSDSVRDDSVDLHLILPSCMPNTIVTGPSYRLWVSCQSSA